MKTISGLGPPIAEFPPGEPIVGLVNFKDRLYVATSKRIFEIVNNELVPISFQMVEDADPGRTRESNNP
jgi:hypothetical protein